VPGLALATAGGVWAEVRRAANAPLPRFSDLDASGRYGVGGDPVRIAVLGDSSLTGPGLAHGSGIWIAQLANRLPWDVDLCSHARGGSRVHDVLMHQAPFASRSHPDLFVVAVGANDALHVTPTRQFAQHLDALIGRLSTVAPVVTLGLGDLSVIPRVPRSLRAALSRRCAAIDRIHDEVTRDRDRVVRVPVAELVDPHFREPARRFFSDDLFHPNEDGHALWAELFRHYVHAALERFTAPAQMA
jgi:lysophospholipase L1-like esterase